MLLPLPGAILLSHSAPAATAPYYEDFESYPVGSTPNNFVTSVFGIFPAQNSTWQVTNPTSMDGVYENVVVGHMAGSSAAVNITNLSHMDFQLSTAFELGGYFAPNPISAGRAGLAALSSGSDFTMDGYQLSYQVYGPGTGNNQGNGTLTLYRPGAALAHPGEHAVYERASCGLRVFLYNDTRWRLLGCRAYAHRHDH
jgi:hypothetical protein